MTVRLSKRMRMLADLVSAGNVLADVGCDHGLLPIYLVSTGKVRRAIAMDLRPGPLERARENIRAYCCEDRVETRLSDGLENIAPEEADRILIAGMGGGIMLHILRKGAKSAQAAELILQPQSEIYEVRRFLWEQGYDILAEEIVEEDGKFYPAMRAVFRGGSGERLPEERTAAPAEEELLFGAHLIQRRHPVLKDYLKREEAVYRKLKASMEQLKDPGEKTLRRAEEIDRRLTVIVRTLERFDVEKEECGTGR